MSSKVTILDLMRFTVAPRFVLESAPELVPPQVAHYCNDSASSEWLAAMRQMESEGEISPAQRSLA